MASVVVVQHEWRYCRCVECSLYIFVLLWAKNVLASTHMMCLFMFFLCLYFTLFFLSSIWFFCNVATWVFNKSQRQTFLWRKDLGCKTWQLVFHLICVFYAMNIYFSKLQCLCILQCVLTFPMLDLHLSCVILLFDDFCCMVCVQKHAWKIGGK
jgi:hypothetical protein